MTAPIGPKRPPAHWTRLGRNVGPARAEAFKYAGLLVLSSLDTMEAPDGSGDILPTWLISVSKGGKRASDRDVKRVLDAFGASEALEDNHGPGISRAFFLVVDPARRVDCECKAGEALVTEPGGYQWSNDVNGPCRGCEYERAFGRPCPIHHGKINLGAP